MKVKDYLAIAVPSDRIIIVKGKEELYRGYVALLKDNNIEEMEIERTGAYPYLTTKAESKEVGKKETPDYSCTDLDIKVYVRINVI